MRHRYPLIALLFLAFGLPAMPAYARSDDDGTISIMTPEKGTVKPGKPGTARKHIIRRGASKPVTRRGSSNPVYPIPLPAPQSLTPPPTQQAVTPRRSRVLPPIVVPETGRALPNLPSAAGSGRGGAETFQERALRCSHQAGIYGDATGNRNAYVGSCINQ